MSAIWKWVVGELRLVHALWAEQRSWKTRLVVLVGVTGLMLLGASAIYLWRNPEKFWFTCREVRRGWNVLFDREKNVPPLTGDARDHLKELSFSWQQKIRTVIEDRDNRRDVVNAWALSQLVMASREVPTGVGAIIQELENAREADPRLWKELSDSKRVHVVASAWSLMALRRLGARAPVDSIEDLLDLQAPDGFWVVYPVEKIPKRAATYATAFAALSLRTWLDAPDLPPSLRESIKVALKKSQIWLNDSRRGGRWRDYPRDNPEGVDSLAASGLAIHALASMPHEQSVVNPQRVAEQWSTHLPQHLSVSLVHKEISGMYLGNESASDLKDAARMYVWPWLVIATADAYRQGRFLDRWKALSWLEESFVRNLDDAAAGVEIEKLPWVAAEFEISLRRLLEGPEILRE